MEADDPYGRHGHDQIEVDRTEARTVVRVYGDLDRETAGALSRCLAGLCDGGAADLVVDLDGVPYCDSSGIGALLGAHCRIDGSGGHLELRQAVPDVRHVLEERGLDRVLHLV